MILPILFFAGCLMAAGTTMAQGWQWAGNGGGTSTDEAEIVDVDHDGNIVITGKFSGSFQFGPYFLNSFGGKDIFTAKLDTAGNLLWVATAGGFENDEGLCVAADDSNNVLVTGFYRGQAAFGTTILTGGISDEVFIAKYSPSGALKWVRNAYGPGEDRGKGIDADRQGNVLVTGYYKDTCYFGGQALVSPGLDNVFLAKYSPGGILLWVSDAGGPYETWASSVSTDAFSNVYITGSFKDTAAFGTHTLITFGGNDVFLARADSSGSWTMAVHTGGIDNDYGNGIEVDVFNNVAVTGSFFQTVAFPPAPNLVSHGDKDGFVAYFNPQGQCLWARNMGGAGSDKGIGVSTDYDGNVYATGYVSGIPHFDAIIDTAAGGDDVFIARYSNTGAVQYASLAGGTSYDYGKGIAVDEAGIAYVTGFFQTTAHFGSITLVTAGDRDVYLAKYYDGSPRFMLQPEDDTVCAGDSVTLQVAVYGPGPFSYLWFDHAGSILGAVNSQYSFVAADTSYSGLYYCIVGNSYGSAGSNRAYISVAPLPVVSLGPDTMLWSHDSIKLDAGSGYTSYLWSTQQTTQSIVVAGSSLVWGVVNPISVTVTNAWGCEGSDTIMLRLIINDIPEFAKPNPIKVMPNPAEDILLIRSVSEEMQNISIFDIHGKLIVNVAAEAGATEMAIDISRFQSGMYLGKIRMIDGNEYFSKLVRK